MTSPISCQARPRSPGPSLLALGVALVLLAGPVRAQETPPPERRGQAAVTQLSDPNPPIAGRVDPRTYRVGPGDEFALRYSDLLDPKVVRVGPAGDLLLPDVGSIAVAGLTLAEMETLVRERMRPYVRGKGFGITLYRPRRFRLFVAGEVARPGVVTLQAPVRASEAIEAAGGVAGGGARRGIQVRRGPDTLRVDLLLSSRGGDLAADPLVFETDVIYVPPLGRRVEIHGALAHPDRFDWMPGDRLSSLVALAGGALPEASLAEATLERFDAAGVPRSEALRLDLALGAPGGSEDWLLQEGDRLFVPGRARWLEGDMVEIAGEVARPGPYPIRSGQDRVRALLARAGGLTSLADTAAVRVESDPDAAPRDSILEQLASRTPDLVSPADREFVVAAARERRAVSAPVGALLARNDPRGDVPLYDGDRIVVPRRIPLVAVQGEVAAPGYVPYVPGRRASEYVKDAGGFTDRANKGRARVTLASTGRQVGASEAGVLRPGDIVWVPAKEERSTWSQVRDALTTAAQIATVYLVVREATR